MEAENVTLPKLDGLIAVSVLSKDKKQIEAISPNTKEHEATQQERDDTEDTFYETSLESDAEDSILSEESSEEEFNYKGKLTEASLSTEAQEFSRLGEMDIIEPPPGAYFLFEETRKLYLLLDTGATHSLLPSKIVSTSNRSVEVISGVTGNTMQTCGRIKILLDFGLSIKFQHEFLIADLPYTYGILGSDFLAKHCFQICFASATVTHLPSRSFVEMEKISSSARSLRKLSESHTEHHILQCIKANGESLCKSQESTEEEEQCKAILEKFPNLLKEPSYFSPPKHNFVLDIELKENCTIYQRPRKVPAAEFHAINENFNKLLQNAAVVKTSSNFASPVTVVKKKSGDYRVCVDYRQLNAQTVDLNFPIPAIANLQFLLSKEHTWYSVLDLKSAYYSLPLTERASERAAIITQRGVFQPLRSPFGLKNSPAKFCELVSSVIEGLETFTFAYLDDFLVFSKTFSDHQDHLKTLFSRLDSYGLFLSPEKCKLAQTEVVFLGHLLSRDGIRPLQEKTDFIATIKPPKTVRELRSFLGIANYYRDHCKDFSQITAPLSKLLCGPKRPKKSIILWEEEQQKAFETAIEVLKKAETLAHDEVDRPLVLTTDASETHAGGVLEQFVHPLDDNIMYTPSTTSTSKCTTRPLSYFSQAFSTSTKVRSTFNRELSALYMTIRHFRFKLRGRKLIIRTDHRSLVRAVENPEGLHSPLERRMIYQIKEYMPKILHLAGNSNAVADHLSRPYSQESENDIVRSQTELVAILNVETPPHPQPTLSISILAEAQSRCHISQNTTHLREQINASDQVVEKQITEGDASHRIVGIQDNTLGYFRPYLPEELRIITYNQLHGVIHQGKQKSCEVIEARYFWPNMKADIEKWTKTCPECQKCKVSRHTRQRLQCYPANPRRLSTIHIDLMGPLPVSTTNQKYVCTMRDRGTGFLVAAALSDKTSFSVLRALKLHFIAPFGVPTTIISDNGQEFRSNEFSVFCTDLGITHKFVTAYHPQANGLVERIHRTIRVAFRASNEPRSWADALPLITLAINNQISDNNSFTPYQMVFGQAARLPGTFFFDSEENNSSLQPIAEMRVFQENMRHFQRSSRQQEIQNPHGYCDLSTVPQILLRDDGNQSPLSPLYAGPFTVVTRSEKYFTIDTDRGPRNVSIDRLKPYYRISDNNDLNNNS